MPAPPTPSSDPPASGAEPGAPPRRPWTILGRLSKAVREQNWFAVALEVCIVVLGVFIGMQVANWNEQRKQDERFRFGLQELYMEALALTFWNESYADKLSYQVALIDTLLLYGGEVAPERLPSIIQALDDHGFESRDFAWKTEFLEFTPGDDERNRIAKSLRQVVRLPESTAGQLESRLDLGMEQYLQDRDIPLRPYGLGTSNSAFVQAHPEAADYTAPQLARAVALLDDPSFVADLMTMRAVKESLARDDALAESVEAAVAFIRDYAPDVDFSIRRMEILGDGLSGGGWTNGVPMWRVSDDDDRVWEVEHELVDGSVKFRSDEEWVLDWGRGELDPEALVFKGGNIPVESGRYRIRIDIGEGTVRFTPLD